MSLLDDLRCDPIPGLVPTVSRDTRFTGESQRCQLADLSPDSRLALRCLYDWLESIGRHLGADAGSHTMRAAMRALLANDRLEAASGWARSLSPLGSVRSPRMSRILHDIRGSALLQLIALAARAGDDGASSEELTTMVILARDHAKVLRHTILGLDDARRAMDGAMRRHGTANLEARLPVLVLCGWDGQVRVTFDVGYRGDFAQTCPEFSTVLKQVYHLVDNACRYTADHRVLVGVYPKPVDAPVAIRLVVANPIDTQQRETLAHARGLWRDFSTTGSGLGLSATADLVTQAFGLEDGEVAVNNGYVGSRLTDAGYVAWLHWPVLAAADAVAMQG